MFPSEQQMDPDDDDAVAARDDLNVSMQVKSSWK